MVSGKRSPGGKEEYGQEQELELELELEGVSLLKSLLWCPTLHYSKHPKRERKKIKSPARQSSFAGGKSLGSKTAQAQKLDFSIEEDDLVQICGEQPGLLLDTI